MPQFSLGWKRQLSDPRDYLLRVPGKITAALPPSFDLEASLGPKLDQGALGSCGPNTVAECIDYDEAVQGDPVAVPSRLFIYYTTRTLMGTVGQDSGVDNRTLLKAMNQFGIVPESFDASTAYDISRFRQKPSDAAYAEAAKNKIDNYATVEQILDQMKGCLVLTKRPFIFGFQVYQQIMSDEATATGLVRDPAFLESPIGGHDVSFVAFDDAGFGIPYFQGKGAFKFRNHWRDGQRWWGDNAYGYISYPYATNANLSGDFWCINAVPGHVTPTPDPVPPDPTPVPPPQPSPCKQHLAAALSELGKATIALASNLKR